MARGMNRATVIGFVEREPEVRQTPDGQPVASFVLTTNRDWTTNAGVARHSTEWFSVVAWGRLAELASRRLRKGQRIYAEGHLQTRSWEDSEGQKQYRTEFVASKLIPMTNGRDADPSTEELGEEMPLCLNRIIVIGNLGRDPEMRYTPGGQAVTSFSLAATRTWTTASGDRRDATEWFNVIAWGSLAEICNQYLSKGRRAYVEGELRTRAWELPDGSKHVRTELVASEMIILGPRPANDNTEDEPSSKPHRLEEEALTS